MADQKVTELKDLKVGEVSLVDQAAIGRTWLVTKRAENNTEKAMPANAKAEDAPKAAEAVETKSAEQIDKSAEPIGTVETVTKAVRYMDIWMSVDDPSAQAVAAFFGSMTEELQKRGIDTPEDLAKMADELEALKKSQAEADEIVTKAKHFTATRTEAIQGAVETLQSVLTEVTANDIAVDASPVEEAIVESAEDTAVAKAMTAMTAVLEKVSNTNETIAKALANSKAKVAASEDALEKAKAKNETLEKAVETLETTQPPSFSEAPVVKSDGKVETVRKSDDELFGFVGR